MISLENMDLHDAFIYSLEYSWDKKIVEIQLSIFLSKEKDAILHDLRFSGISSFQATHKSPWGPSNCINSADITNQFAKFELQSGDEINIEFNSFSLKKKAE